MLETKKQKQNNEGGFSLIETLVGIAILVFLSLTLYSLFDFTLRVLWENKARAGAQVLANQIIETGHNLPYADLGTVGGIPNGTIEPVQTVTNNGIEYTVSTAIIYVDDEFDGTLGGVPEDLLPADYKRIRVEISWNYRLSSTPVVFLSDVSPMGIESEEGGGTLRVTVLDASGLPVPQASVHIENNSLIPAVNVDLQTNSNGQIILPGALESVEAYEVIATKPGYSTDRTYDIDPVNLPSPIKPHVTVLEGQVTDASFAIDILSDMNVFAFTENEYTPAWWDEDYTIRRRLTVTNNNSDDTLPAGYSVRFDFDHYNQVQQLDALASGDDVRLLWWDGVAWNELNRVAESAWNNSTDPTQIWFATQAQIPAGDYDDNYFLYYGNSSPAAPLDDPHLVYQFYDDFSDPAYTYANWATSTNDWIVEGGEYHQTSSVGETRAWAGSLWENHLVEADVRTATANNNAGLIGRYINATDYGVVRPAAMPISVSSADDTRHNFGSQALVEASDGTLALFTNNTAGEYYRMFISIDDGATWQENWALSVPSESEFGQSAWINPADDTIYYVFTQYVAVSDDYHVRFIPFTYDSGMKIWNPGAAGEVAANNYSERPFRPHLMVYNNELFVTYARYDSSGNHEIAMRKTSDGYSWSAETFLTDWNENYSNQNERDSIEGQLVVYNNQLVALLNGSRMAGWRSYNGSTWSAYQELITGTFHDNAFATTVTGSVPNQTLHILYRYAGDSGRAHEYYYNGSTWNDRVVTQETTNFAYSTSEIDGDVLFFYGTPNDNTAALWYRLLGSSWSDAHKINASMVPMDEIITLPAHLRPGLAFVSYIAGASGSAQVYAHRIGVNAPSGISLPVASFADGGALSAVTPAGAEFTTDETYRLRATLEDENVDVWTDEILTFSSDIPSFSNPGKFGLYTNATEAYFDNALVRLFITPEPSVAGDLEEELSVSQPLPDFPFNLRGSKLIGYDASGLPVHKYSATSTTDGSGRADILDLEWDSYQFTIDDTATGYDIAGIDPPDPVSVLPDTTQQVNIYLVADALHTLRVVVLDADDQPVEDASVRVYHAGLSFDETQTTPSYGQVFYTPMSAATYNIEVTHPSFDSYSGTVAVSNDTVEVVLMTSAGSAPPPTPPSAPVISGFPVVTDTSMTITWNDVADNEDGYRVYRNTVNTKPGSSLVTLPAGTTNYPSSGLTCETTYYFWIEAYNGQGTAEDTASQITLACPTPPSVPVITGFSNSSETQFNVDWTDVADNEDGYYVYINTVNTKPGTVTDDLPADTETYQFIGLNCNTTYYVWVEAYNNEGTADATDNTSTLTCEPTLVFSDSFNVSSDTYLQSHTPNVGTGWTLLIEQKSSGSSYLSAYASGDQLRRSTCAGNEGALYQTDALSNADYEVQVTQINGDNGDDYDLLAARIQDANNMYVLLWNESSSTLYRRVSGTWNIIDGPVSGIGDGSTVILKVQGSTISVTDDGATKLSAVDASHSAAGRAGIGMGGVITSTADCSSQRLDNFQVWETP